MITRRPVILTASSRAIYRNGAPKSNACQGNLMKLARRSLHACGKVSDQHLCFCRELLFDQICDNRRTRRPFGQEIAKSFLHCNGAAIDGTAAFPWKAASDE
jgi:hypothetical protein